MNYGLGSENRDLPGFVVLNFDVVPCGGLENFGSGFLPANYQASIFKADGTPIDNIVPADKDRRVQRAKLDLLRQQDSEFAAELGGDSAVEAAIRNYEMAYRMQSLVPDVLDLARETEAPKAVWFRFAGANATAIRQAMPPRAAAGGSRRAFRRGELPSRRLQRHLRPARQPEEGS